MPAALPSAHAMLPNRPGLGEAGKQFTLFSCFYSLYPSPGLLISEPNPQITRKCQNRELP